MHGTTNIKFKLGLKGGLSFHGYDAAGLRMTLQWSQQNPIKNVVF